ncbi:hypothetical protein [Sphingomonas sp. S2-65]|uniref:hypothetical protein n=1 Tax=Sphingomonas sp. S2-65 TaxID=2903960 RepID=UPI001F30269E|nr:hypothetical protein [Sphingomonas sp. S2-65]UYY58750.1 hypothetical protein LZ586_01175 [Sphingomonas sp. S2-65]
MMAGNMPNGTGPEDQSDKDNPGGETLNPSGVSTDAPAEGGEESEPKQPGSPQG